MLKFSFQTAWSPLKCYVLVSLIVCMGTGVTDCIVDLGQMNLTDMSQRHFPCSPWGRPLLVLGEADSFSLRPLTSQKPLAYPMTIIHRQAYVTAGLCAQRGGANLTLCFILNELIFLKFNCCKLTEFRYGQAVLRGPQENALYSPLLSGPLWPVPEASSGRYQCSQWVWSQDVFGHKSGRENSWTSLGHHPIFF